MRLGRGFCIGTVAFVIGMALIVLAAVWKMVV